MQLHPHAFEHIRREQEREREQIDYVRQHRPHVPVGLLPDLSFFRRGLVLLGRLLIMTGNFLQYRLGNATRYPEVRPSIEQTAPASRSGLLGMK